ncbi:MAG: RIO1 family regulatory kinase/ATPase [Acidilobus sp.]
MLSLADRVSAVDSQDVGLLRLAYRLHNSFTFIPLSVLEGSYRSAHDLSRKLSKLLELGLIRSARGSEYMFQLTFRGLDVLAVAELTRRGVLARIGDVLGVGKESEIYLSWTPTGLQIALKLHREGTRSFRGLLRTRWYRALSRRSQLYGVAIEAAGREFAALTSVRRAGGLVPRPIDKALHAVAAEYLDGVELVKARELSRDEAVTILNDVLTTVKAAYRIAGVVHGDLSAYNVLVVRGSKGVRGYVIDWPQYLDASDPLARQTLLRDLVNIATYFNKTLGLDIGVEDLLREVEEG